MQPKSLGSPSSKTGVNFQPVVFDTRSDTDFSLSVFARTKDVLGYLKTHFPQVAMDGRVMTGAGAIASTGIAAAAGMVQEKNTYQDTDPASFYATQDICPLFLGNNQHPGNDPDEETIGASTAYENIQTTYGQRGIECTLNFSVSYAPRNLNSTISKKMVYMNGPVQPSLVLMGGDLGILSTPVISYSIQQDGTGLIEARIQEMRTAVVTNKNHTTYLSGDPERYPVGYALGGGETVIRATAAPTDYHLRYVLAFFDEGMAHEQREWMLL